MANSNHIFSLARTKYPKSHWWQDVGIEIRSLLLFENPGRVPAICPSLPGRKWQDKRKEGYSSSNMFKSQMKIIVQPAVQRPRFTWKYIPNFAQSFMRGFCDVSICVLFCFVLLIYLFLKWLPSVFQNW